MYAIRRTIVAALIGGALLFSAVPVTAAPPHAHTLAQVMAAGSDLPDGGTITGPGSTYVQFAQDGSLNIGGANGATITIGPNGGISAASGNAALSLTPDGRAVLFGGGGVQVALNPGGLIELVGYGITVGTSLPTSDPGVTGELWNDGGTVRVSAG